MSSDDSDDFLMISGLQHLLFCPRQAALIHLEQEWAENHLTIEGQHQHREVDTAGLKLSRRAKLARAMPLVSHQLRLSGRADLVVFEPGGAIVPVEYKHGSKGRWDHNEVQLCAQAIALEEMFSTSIELGLIYYQASRRRQEVPIDANLRQMTFTAAAEFHRLIATRTTPLANPDARCRSCSLASICMPEACNGRSDLLRYMED